MSTTRTPNDACLCASDDAWVPNITNVTNIAAVSLVAARWHRIRSQLVLSIRVQVTPTAGSATTAIAFDLPPPVTSPLAATSDLIGHGTAIGGQNSPAQWFADTVNQRLQLTWASISTTQRTWDVIGVLRLR